jgi:hypothetical protein
MAKVELLTLSSLFGLFSPQGVYLLAYAWLFGMCAFSNHPFDLSLRFDVFQRCG